MEEDGHHEEETPTSPFWLQTTTNLSRIQRYHRRISTLFFNSGVFIIFLLIIFALLSILLIIPTLIQFSYQIFTPNSLKKSWNSINFIMVLIALAFGFLARNINNDEKVTFENGFDRNVPESSTGAPIMSPATSTNPQWYDFNDQPMNYVNGLRRQRTSNSYPDLREISPPPDHRDRRFSDDTHLHYYRNLESNRNYIRQRSRLEDNAYGGIPPPPDPPCLPALAPPHMAAMKKKAKRISYNVSGEDGEGSRRTVGKIWSPEKESSEYTGRKKLVAGETRRRARSSEPRKNLSPVISPAPESSSPAAISPLTLTKKGFFTSFYHKKNKKKHRSVDNLYSLLNQSQPPPVRLQPPPPVAAAAATPPPPPPPPPSLHKKKIITFTPTFPAPPPPPLPPRRRTELRPPPEKPRGPLTMMSGYFNGVDESSSGGDSPVKNIPAPPLPPFKLPDLKFAVEGDFVRLLSSRSVSPSSDVEASPSSAVAEVVAPPWQSADVDDIADSFIARFRAG